MFEATGFHWMPLSLCMDGQSHDSGVIVGQVLVGQVIVGRGVEVGLVGGGSVLEH